ncbi:hypothetical protein [Streptomyces leeuwenhoekii]|uniref:Uncharacterized protein n=1 Tax=Streptomyces leeuwenhoekii TaxID=1437453 RepID=A0A0F7VLD8_STRLW|nr:hypothetical protein [Streptomyces leeuwenhoekii]CQR59500.1 Conserved Hypothetical Protein [Streptomyces leeuwenhoekii]
MPTYETLPRFTTDLQHLTPAQRRRFRRVVREAFVPDLRTGCFRPGLRVKRVQRASGIYELTSSMGAGPAGRATWQYGPALRPGVPHVIWRRIGTHDILTGP